MQRLVQLLARPSFTLEPANERGFFPGVFYAEEGHLDQRGGSPFFTVGSNSLQ